MGEPAGRRLFLAGSHGRLEPAAWRTGA